MSKSRRLILFLSVLLTVFLFYAWSAGRHATGYADSDELLMASFQWSLPHPSGFPLLVLITGFIMRLSRTFLEPAFAGNLAASLMQSISLACLAVSAAVVLESFNFLSKKRFLLALYCLIFISACGIAVTGYYWLYGSVLEAASYTNALIALTTTGALLWWSALSCRQPAHRWWFWLTWLSGGLALSHIHTTVLVFPGLAVLLILSYRYWRSFKFYRRFSSWLIALLLLLIGFIGPNLLIFWFDSRAIPVSWGIEASFPGWWRYITRQDYAGYFPEEATSRPAYLTPLRPYMITSQPEIVKYLLTNLSLLGLSLSIVGMFGLWKKQRSLFWVVLTWLLISGPLFIGYMGFPEYNPQDLEYGMKAGITYRQFLILHYFWSLILVIGTGFLFLSLIHRRTLRVSFLLTALISGLLINFNIHSHHRLGIQKNNRIAQIYARSMLDSAAPDSIIICSSDIACFSLLFAQQVENYRPKVTVLTKNDLYIRRFLIGRPDLYGFTYRDNPYFMAHLIAWNLLDKRVYLTNPTTYYIDYVGLDGNPFYLIPTGYLFEVVKTAPSTLPSLPQYPVEASLSSQPPPHNDHYMMGMNGYLASLHQTIGILLANYDHLPEALNQFNFALRLFPGSDQTRSWLDHLGDFKPPDAYSPGTSSSSQYLLTQANQLLLEGQLDPAYAFMRKASYLDPTNLSIHTQLFDLYLLGRFFPEAQLEIDQISKLNPHYSGLFDLSQRLATASAAFF